MSWLDLSSSQLCGVCSAAASAAIAVVPAVVVAVEVVTKGGETEVNRIVIYPNRLQ